MLGIGGAQTIKESTFRKKMDRKGKGKVTLFWKVIHSTLQGCTTRKLLHALRVGIRREKNSNSLRN